MAKQGYYGPLDGHVEITDRITKSRHHPAAVIRPTSPGNSPIPRPLTSYLSCFSLSHHFQSKGKVSESLDVLKTQVVSLDSFPIRIEIHACSSDGSNRLVMECPSLAVHSWDRPTTDFNGGTPVEDEHFEPENTP